MDTDSIQDKNPATPYGRTPLHLVAEKGHIEVFGMILDRVPVKNPPDGSGRTPLHQAAHWGHPEICCAILEVVEDKAPLDKYGKTPLQVAIDAVASGRWQSAEARDLIRSYQ